jgi:hypothetical protein
MRLVRTRFGIVLDPRGGALAQMLPIFRLGLGGTLGSGKQWMSWVALPDVVGAILFAIEKGDLQGAVNVVAPSPVRAADFTKILGKVLHRPTVFPVPALALKILMGEMAQELLLSGQKVSPKALEGAGFQFAYPELEGALRAMFQ